MISSVSQGLLLVFRHYDPLTSSRKADSWQDVAIKSPNITHLLRPSNSSFILDNDVRHGRFTSPSKSPSRPDLSVASSTRVAVTTINFLKAFNVCPQRISERELFLMWYFSHHIF
jgi:hypothetical protein